MIKIVIPYDPLTVAETHTLISRGEFRKTSSYFSCGAVTEGGIRKAAQTLATLLGVPTFAISNITITVHSSYYDLSGGYIIIDDNDSLLKARGMGHTALMKAVRDIRIDFQPYPASQPEGGADGYLGDGLIINLLNASASDSGGLNSLGAAILKRLEAKVSPRGLASMHATRGSLSRYLQARGIPLSEAQNHVEAWLASTSVGSGVHHVFSSLGRGAMIADRYQVFSLADKDFGDWAKDLAVARSSAYVTSSMIASSGLIEGTVAAEVGTAIGGSVITEVLSAVAAILII